MKALSFIGRLVYSVPFAIMGVFHFMKAHLMAAQILKGWPIADGFVYISGLALIMAAVSIIINFKARLACQLLALLLLTFIVGLHIPSILKGSELAMTMLLKDVALMGAALSYSTILNK
jgi:putative oxidoreductase